MKKQVTITYLVEVEVDETKFTPQFLEEYQEHHRPFETIDDHITHIAMLAAQDLLDETFTEGYGPLKDMGISAQVFMLD